MSPPPSPQNVAADRAQTNSQAPHRSLPRQYDSFPLFESSLYEFRPSRPTLKNFTIVPTAELPQDEECPICREQYSDKDESHIAIRLTAGCGHVFGRDCLQEWANTTLGTDSIGFEDELNTSVTRSCPQCRSSLSPHLSSSRSSAGPDAPGLQGGWDEDFRLPDAVDNVDLCDMGDEVGLFRLRQSHSTNSFVPSDQNLSTISAEKQS